MRVAKIFSVIVIDAFLLLWILAFLLVGSDLYAISRRHDVDDNRYIRLAISYPSVGRFNNGFSNGSGVLIARRWVLTASHNLMFQTAPFMFEIGGASYRIDWSRRHFAMLPHTYAASFSHDIALAHLERPVNNVAPANLYNGNQELGMIVTVVGYGMAGDGRRGVPIDRSGQHKRAGQNVIDAIGNFDGHQVTVDPSSTLLFFDFDAPAGFTKAQNWFGGSDMPLALEAMTTSGDSGGGLFAETPAGTELVGINSGVFPGVSGGASHKYGIISRNVRVSAYVAWINETIRKFESGAEPLKGLVAHWNFDDLSEGFAQDVSGMGHRGNLVGVSPAPGILGGAVEFLAPGKASKYPMYEKAYVAVPNETGAWNGVVANDLKIRNDITIAVWVYRHRPHHAGVNLSGNIAPIVAKASASRKKCDFALVVWGDHLRFYSGAKNFARSPIVSIPYRAWYHLAVTRAGQKVKFYVNGKLVGHDRLAEKFPLSDNPLIIGNSPASGWNFSGKMDELRIYKRALSAKEIKLIAARDQL